MGGNFTGVSGLGNYSPLGQLWEPKLQHDNSSLGIPGALIGNMVGSYFFGPAGGQIASGLGQNAGFTLGDLFGGNMNNLGWDMSANLPPIPGFQAGGTKGMENTATGLPISGIADLFK